MWYNVQKTANAWPVKPAVSGQALEAARENARLNGPEIVTCAARGGFDRLRALTDTGMA